MAGHELGQTVGDGEDERGLAAVPGIAKSWTRLVLCETLRIWSSL